MDLHNTNVTKYQTRMAWLDSIKGVGIICIMWGHVQLASPLKNWITVWHVPIFLVITGFLLSNKAKEICYKDCFGSIRRNIYPYIVFSVIAIFIQILFDFYRFHELNQVLPRFMENIYMSLLGYGIGPLWFLPAYITARLIYEIAVCQKNE